MDSDDIFWLIVMICIFAVICFGTYTESKIEHEKTIQKAIECGYEPLCIGCDYWNKGD